jgi:hypothetical protein
MGKGQGWEMRGELKVGKGIRVKGGEMVQGLRVGNCAMVTWGMVKGGKSGRVEGGKRGKS